jgi:DNA-binding transcriptional LysR family regulator
MDLAPLIAFRTIAAEGHMTRAARRLGLTQPAVSAQLARLEDELGQRLLDRTPKGMRLNDAGRVFLRHVDRALASLDEGRRSLDELAGLARGTLDVGGGATATTYLLPSVLGRFHDRYPAIRLFVREQGSAAVVEGVLSGALDLGVVTLPLSGELPGARHLVVEPWVVDELLLVVPPGHRLQGRARFGWTDLEGEPMVLFEAGSAVRAVIDGQLEARGLHAEIVMELRSIDAMKQMVAQGIGVSLISRFALSDGEGLRCGESALTRPMAVVYGADRTLSAAARAFLDLLREARGRVAGEDGGPERAG